MCPVNVKQNLALLVVVATDPFFVVMLWSGASDYAHRHAALEQLTAPAPASHNDALGPWWKSRLVFLAGACVAFIYLFVRFASEVAERETGTFDTVVRDWVFAHRPPFLVAVFRVVTWLGSWVVLVPIAAVVGFVLVRRGARKRPLVIAMAPFALSLIVWALKAWYRIGRPPAGLTAALTFSFPSGHTSGSTAVAIVIGFVLARERVAPRLGWAIALVVPIVVGVSRIYLDVHWASDVVGGWMVGAAYAAAVCALYERAHRRASSRAPA